MPRYRIPKPITATRGPRQPIERERPHWIRFGQRIQIHGITLRDGMIWVGSPDAALGDVAEPSLIDPELPVTPSPGRIPEEIATGPSLSYQNLDPSDRWSYLKWLANGRTGEDAPLAFLLLFLYGIERRLLHAVETDNPSALNELPALGIATFALWERFGNDIDPDLRQHLMNLVDVFDLLSLGVDIYIEDARADIREIVNGPGREITPAPLHVQLGLGGMVAEGLPLPADWAFAWAWYRPEVDDHPDSGNGLDEFIDLFAIRYREAHGDGMMLYPGTQYVRPRIRTCNPTIGIIEIEVGEIPEVISRTTPGAKLVELYNTALEEIAPFRRWLAESPDATREEVMEHLPERLRTDVEASQAALRTWVEDRLAGKDIAIVDYENIMAQAGNGAREDPLIAGQSIGMLLAEIGIGVEPDFRNPIELFDPVT
ncbi:MAG TPA: TerB N-terminal domain-containing protein, partial [Thermomicrobiales bacterium]|nr:TerB N-terminal domain-containing protein [Thermomicrobiales bacterium]